MSINIYNVGMQQKGWIVLSGCIWLGAGISLLYKGLHFIADGILLPHSLSAHLQGLFGSAHYAGNGLIACALLVGFLKGRFVLSKTADRVVQRIRSQTLPIRLSQVYAPSYWILISAMVCLGVFIRFLPIPIDMRGWIDVVIGSALIQGSIFYFRALRFL